MKTSRYSDARIPSIARQAEVGCPFRSFAVNTA